ncbi:hypothetical protein DFH09DRAFT_1091718 [Mycena vulgaris]|nr:hypothetical protein DFH09DRAFT_1091718 [Mycena vulgaris]
MRSLSVIYVSASIVAAVFASPTERPSDIGRANPGAMPEAGGYRSGNSGGPPLSHNCHLVNNFTGRTKFPPNLVIALLWELYFLEEITAGPKAAGPSAVRSGVRRLLGWAPASCGSSAG